MKVLFLLIVLVSMAFSSIVNVEDTVKLYEYTSYSADKDKIISISKPINHWFIFNGKSVTYYRNGMFMDVYTGADCKRPVVDLCEIVDMFKDFFKFDNFYPVFLLEDGFVGWNYKGELYSFKFIEVDGPSSIKVPNRVSIVGKNNYVVYDIRGRILMKGENFSPDILPKNMLVIVSLTDMYGTRMLNFMR